MRCTVWRRIVAASRAIAGSRRGTVPVLMEGLEGRRLMARTTYLSDLLPASATNGLGPVELDRSNGGQAAGDGRVLAIGAKRYGRGLGVRAGSTIVYDLGGKYDTFESAVGVDREVGRKGSVTFRVFLDGKKAYDSGRMVGGQAAKSVLLNVVGKRQLKLVAADAGGGKEFDHGDWAGARLASRRKLPPPIPTASKPTASNTGPTNRSLLRASGSIDVTADGAVIRNVNVNGTITVNASNVTIRNFRVTSSGDYGIFIGAGAENVVISNGELTGSHIAAVYGANFTARRLNVHHAGADGVKALSDCVIDRCYIHDLGMDPAAHADGVQGSGGSDLTITNNNIDVPEYTTGGQTYLSNSAVFIHSYFGPVDNVLIEGNWLNGGNYTVYSINARTGYGPPTHVRIVNNVFGPDDKYGTLDVDRPTG